MNFKKHILLFFLKFTIVYLILLLPAFRTAYADFFRTNGERLFGSFGEKGMIKFKESKKKSNEDVQTVIWLFNKEEYKRNKITNTPINIAYIENNWLNDYLAVAFLIALIAATPIGWKRKLLALFAGLFLIHVYLSFALWMAFMYQFHINPQLDVLHLSGFSEKPVSFLYELLNKNPGTIVFSSLVIWIIVILRKSDWEKISTPN